MQILPVPHYGASIASISAKSARIVVGPVSFGGAKFDADGGISFVHTGEEPIVIRARITRLLNDMLALPDKAELPLAHEFVDGMYIRRLFIPKGTLLVGKIHKQDCINVVESGDIAIMTETGAKRVKAGYLLASPPGIQKVGFANEDTVFTNIFRTDETDIDKLEQALVWDSYESMEGKLLCQ